MRFSKLRIEASTFCQLHCPSCPNARGDLARSLIGRGHLELKALRRFLDRHPGIAEIELSNYGEPFLNPELDSVLDLLAERHIQCTLNNGVNFNTVTERQLHSLVRHGHVTVIKLSIDGATQETYARYRQGGQLQRVLSHIDRLNELKREYDQSRPQLIWQFIPFDYNIHELETARQMARERHMDFFIKQNWDRHFHYIDVPSAGLSSIAFPEGQYPIDGQRHPLCIQLWDSPQINWNGDLLGCCVNQTHSFGNVFLEQTLDDLTRAGTSYAQTQNALLGYPPGPHSPCPTCPHFSPQRR